MDRLAGAWVVVLGLLGCSPPPAESAAASSPRARYTPSAARLFDDTLAPQLFGFDPHARDAAKDPLLPDRVVQADAIFPARAETLSRVGGVDGAGAFELIVRPTGPALVGTSPSEPEILSVPASGPSYPWLSGAGVKWVGKHMLLFTRRFATEEGTVLHFRAEPDSEALRAAIHRHAALRVLRH